MSPASVAQKIKDSPAIQVWIGIGTVVFTLSGSGVGLLLVEQSKDTAFRERGERVTVEEYQRRAEQVDRRLDASDERQRQILETMGRVDERMKSVDENTRVMRDEVRMIRQEIGQ